MMENWANVSGAQSIYGLNSTYGPLEQVLRSQGTQKKKKSQKTSASHLLDFYFTHVSCDSGHYDLSPEACL